MRSVALVVAAVAALGVAHGATDAAHIRAGHSRSGPGARLEPYLCDAASHAKGTTVRTYLGVIAGALDGTPEGRGFAQCHSAAMAVGAAGSGREQAGLATSGASSRGDGSVLVVSETDGDDTGAHGGKRVERHRVGLAGQAAALALGMDFGGDGGDASSSSSSSSSSALLAVDRQHVHRDALRLSRTARFQCAETASRVMAVGRGGVGYRECVELAVTGVRVRSKKQRRRRRRRRGGRQAALGTESAMTDGDDDGQHEAEVDADDNEEEAGAAAAAAAADEDEDDEEESAAGSALSSSSSSSWLRDVDTRDARQFSGDELLAFSGSAHCTGVDPARIMSLWASAQRRAAAVQRCIKRARAKGWKQPVGAPRIPLPPLPNLPPVPMPPRVKRLSRAGEPEPQDVDRALESATRNAASHEFRRWVNFWAANYASGPQMVSPATWNKLRARRRPRGDPLGPAAQAVDKYDPAPGPQDPVPHRHTDAQAKGGVQGIAGTADGRTIIEQAEAQ
jgi:hypothetical protein